MQRTARQTGMKGDCKGDALSLAPNSTGGQEGPVATLGLKLPSPVQHPLPTQLLQPAERNWRRGSNSLGSPWASQETGRGKALPTATACATLSPFSHTVDVSRTIAATQQVGSDGFTQSLPSPTLPSPRSVLPTTAVTYQPCSVCSCPNSPWTEATQPPVSAQPPWGSARMMLIPCWRGGSLCYVSGLRNLASARRTTGLLPNCTAEHRMIHVSSSSAPSPQPLLVWHNKSEWKWLAGCNRSRLLPGTINK